ncbi:DUF2183 domain-containing protein [Formosa sediminum]|uniref:DUF2183 domain-containing protein n=1 Tax=Formosa sediminum TaxID=2594004 RepID=A0A516GM56_9FLAO|nr:App1 family protein [Formosa sediminum]QDO92598.1 DUF2183 domain-containing protein [Formosa sediminum]
MVYSKKASVWELSILKLSAQQTWYRGVVVKGQKEFQNKKGQALRNAIHVLQSYFIPVCAHQEICIQTPTETLHTRTDAHGRFEVIANNKMETEVSITFLNTDLPLKIVQDYPILFSDSASRLDIISDIDDTILVSNTAHIFKRIKTLLFLIPEKRTVIDFSKNIFKAWSAVNPRLFYVSKSESNLFGLLTTFIKYNNLPLGMLVLTPYLNFYQLLKGHKPEQFKLNAIRFLITHSRSKYYVFVGDDSQKDMSIYTTLAKTYPELILKVYIRQTGENVNQTQQNMWEALLATGVSASYFLPEHTETILEEIEHLKHKII